jgi:hypothetical protein
MKRASAKKLIYKIQIKNLKMIKVIKKVMESKAFLTLGKQMILMKIKSKRVSGFIYNIYFFLRSEILEKRFK